MLPRLPSAQETSATDMIFDGTGVENYFVLAAMVGAVYQFRTHDRSLAFSRWKA